MYKIRNTLASSRLFSLLAALLIILLVANKSSSQLVPEPDCLCLDEIETARGLQNPLRLTHAKDGTGRRFIAEQVGLVWIFLEDETRLEKPFLNLTQIVLTSERPGEERGFLAFTFHPNYTVNRRLFIFYSLLIDGTQHVSRFSELQTFEDDPNLVDPASERVLLDVDQPFNNHNGGDIIFGSDDYVYLLTGDGGLAGDPFDQAQDKSSLLGKVLRLDINRIGDTKPYGIPPDNPYLNDPQALPELYSIGWRNPWRGSMDRGDRQSGQGRGRILIGDVGQNAWEEVDILERGGNFAWPAREGPACYRIDLCGNIGPEVFPIHSYNHTATGRCVIGGFVYRGCQSPGLNGLYFMGDYMNGKIFRLKEESQNVWRDRQISMCSEEICDQQGLINTYAPRILSWGEDEDGEVYFLSTDNPSPIDPQGHVYKIIDPFNRQPPCS